MFCSRLAHRALVGTKWALHVGGEPPAWVRSTFTMYFLRAVRWQRIRRSESRLPAGMTGLQRRLPALLKRYQPPVISKSLRSCVVHIHRLLYRCEASCLASSPTVLRSCAANHFDGAEAPVTVRPPWWMSAIQTALEIADGESFYASAPREDHGSWGLSHSQFLVPTRKGEIVKHG